MVNNKGYSKKELKDFKEKIITKKEEVLKDIMDSQDIADNMLDMKWGNLTGAIVVDMRVWNKLKPEYQK